MTDVGRVLVILRQGSGVVPDSGEAILRSRLGRNYRQLPAMARLREKQHPGDIFYSKR
jgi:hypothetical protein